MTSYSNKKILLTGGNGQVAYALKQQATNLVVLTRDQLDITDLLAVRNALQTYQPDIVINAAAYTQVDRAEQEAELAHAVNYTGVKNLAMVCEDFHCPLIHLSTDYVFDGVANQAYTEIDTPSPLSVYGISKWQGEQAIQQYCEKHIIMRVSAVFGVYGNNFVKTIIRLAREKEQLQIVADQITCPTPVANIAMTLLQLCDNPRWGLFHYCGSSISNWYEFAKLIINNARRYDNTLKVRHIEAISTQQYAAAAKRPLYSVLNCEKIKNIYGIQQPDWQTGLNHVIQTLYAT